MELVNGVSSNVLASAYGSERNNYPVERLDGLLMYRMNECLKYFEAVVLKLLVVQLYTTRGLCTCVLKIF